MFITMAASKVFCRHLIEMLFDGFLTSWMLAPENVLSQHKESQQDLVGKQVEFHPHAKSESIRTIFERPQKFWIKIQKPKIVPPNYWLNIECLMVQEMHQVYRASCNKNRKLRILMWWTLPDDLCSLFTLLCSPNTRLHLLIWFEFPG